MGNKCKRRLFERTMYSLEKHPLMDAYNASKWPQINGLDELSLVISRNSFKSQRGDGCKMANSINLINKTFPIKKIIIMLSISK